MHSLSSLSAVSQTYFIKQTEHKILRLVFCNLDSRAQDSRGGRHQTSDAESVSLRSGEAEAFVKQRVTKQVLPGLPDNLRLHELAVHHLARDAPPLVTRARPSGHAGPDTTIVLQKIILMI